MWHVSDGDLHAYLDGALELYPNREAARIREHLDACAACRQRLEEEAGLADDARRVLAGAAPLQIEAPPLELLKRRAESGASEARPATAPAALRWAWAATVVLALGVGWGVGARPFGLGDVEAPARVPEPATAASVAGDSPSRGTGETPVAPLSPPAPAGADEVVTAPRSGAAGVRVADASPPPPEVASATAGRVENPAEGAGRAVTLASLPLPERRDPPGPAPMDDLGSLVARALDTPVRMSEGPRPAEEARREPVRETGTFRSRATAGTTGSSTSTSPATSPLSRLRTTAFPPAPQPAPPVTAPREERRTVREELSTADALFPTPRAPLSLPGIDVRSVEWTELADGRPALLVLQRAQDETPLELRFAGDWLGRGNAVPVAGAAPPSGGPLPTGWSEVSAPFRGGWVLLRGPLPDESLSALLASAGVAPR